MVGSWLQLPVSWELHSEHVKKLMAPIEVSTSDDWSIVSLQNHMYSCIFI